MKQFIQYFLMLFCFSTVLTSCSEDTIDNFDTGTITGIVVAEGTNVPLENVKISTNPNSSTVFTDEDGAFTLEEIPVDQYSVQAELEGYITSFEAAEITASGAIINVVFELQVETANNRPPETPILIAPEDNATNISLNPILVWSGSDPDDDEISYTIELRNNFDDEILSFNTVNDTILEVSGLRYGLRYFWQVGAEDDINDDVIQSEIAVFETLTLPENRYAFVRKIEGNNVIFSADEDGNELMLTSPSANSYRPRQNSAINKIAYLSNSGSETHIFIMDEDGSNQTQVTSQVPVNGFKLEEIDFTWTENGDRLIYPNFNRLYSININGEGLEQIYETTDGSFITEVVVSADESITLLKTNDVNGYNVSIFTIDNQGAVVDNILSGVNGAAGGLDISVNNQNVLYWYDVSGFESANYRQLNSRIFLFNRPLGSAVDLSDGKINGTNDFDCRFAPNEAEIIFTNTSNDGVSQKDIVIADTNPDNSDDDAIRFVFLENGKMPDYE